jgi:hypothetical protein
VLSRLLGVPESTVIERAVQGILADPAPSRSRIAS